MASEGGDPRNSVRGEGSHREPQLERKGVRALIDAGVKTLTSIVKHLTKFGCVRQEEFWTRREE